MTLSRFTEEEDSYAKAVKDLQSRFDKPKRMLKLYLQSITNITPVKSTQSALTDLADTLQESMDGLVRLKQTDAKFILTSLATGLLPDKIRMAWEDSTEGNKAVAPVAEFIEFVRRKADNPLYADKTDGSGYQERRQHKQ